MKLILILTCIFSSIMHLHAGGDATITLGICRDISMSLKDDFIDQGKSLPASFEDFPMLKSSVEKYPGILKHLNTLAIVPNAPIIGEELGISRSRSGRKIFAISRNVSFDYAKNKYSSDPVKGGRYIVAIESPSQDYPGSWISEPEAQIIFKQLKGFDPAKQPLAFQNMNADVSEKPQPAIDISSNPALSDTPKAAAETKRPQAPENTPTTIPFWPWILGVFVILVGIIGWRMMKRQA
jgi:hypothetical protein